MPNISAEFDEKRLLQYLEQHVEGLEGPIHISPYSKQQPHSTFIIHGRSGRYLLRCKPVVALFPSISPIEREFLVLDSLAASPISVPKVYHLCRDNTVIGCEFNVVEYIEGRKFSDITLQALNNDERSVVYDEIRALLTRLHTINIPALELCEYGNPEHYFQREISLWSEQYRTSATQTIPAMEELLLWLPINQPTDDGQIALTHGDFRLNNIIFHPRELRIIALVNWQHSTLGHPYADLAFQHMQLQLEHTHLPSMPNDAEYQKVGLPSEADYISHYCEKMNIKKIRHWNFYLIFSLFRLAAQVQKIKQMAIVSKNFDFKNLKQETFVEELAKTALSLTE